MITISFGIIIIGAEVVYVVEKTFWGAYLSNVSKLFLAGVLSLVYIVALVSRVLPFRTTDRTFSVCLLYLRACVLGGIKGVRVRAFCVLTCAGVFMC